MTDSTLKFEIKGKNGNKHWGLTSCLTKTPYTIGKDSRPATDKELKEGKPVYYPARYFAYIIKDNKPIVLVENIDQVKKNGKIVLKSSKYFKPATIKFNDGGDKFTHYLRNTDLPYLMVSSRFTKASSVKPNTIFHVNKYNQIIHENFDAKKYIIKGI